MKTARVEKTAGGRVGAQVGAIELAKAVGQRRRVCLQVTGLGLMRRPRSFDVSVL